MALHPDDRPPSIDALRSLLEAPAAEPAPWLGAIRANAALITGVVVLLLTALAISVAP
jgi:hypothetical protein